MQEKQLMEHFNFGSGSEKRGQKIKWIRVLVEPTKKSIPNSKTNIRILQEPHLMSKTWRLKLRSNRSEMFSIIYLLCMYVVAKYGFLRSNQKLILHW